MGYINTTDSCDTTNLDLYANVTKHDKLNLEGGM